MNSLIPTTATTVAAAATPILAHPTSSYFMMPQQQVAIPQAFVPQQAIAMPVQPQPQAQPQQPVAMIDPSAFMQFIQAQQTASAAATQVATPAVKINEAVQETVKDALATPTPAATAETEPAATLMPWEEGFSGEFPEPNETAKVSKEAKTRRQENKALARMEKKYEKVAAKLSELKRPVGRPFGSIKMVKPIKGQVVKASHPTSMSSVSRVHLKGRKVAFAGDFKGMSTIAAQAFARKYGATVISTAFALKSADILVAGSNSSAKAMEAKKAGVRVIDYTTFKRSIKL